MSHSLFLFVSLCLSVSTSPSLPVSSLSLPPFPPFLHPSPPFPSHPVYHSFTSLSPPTHPSTFPQIFVITRKKKKKIPTTFLESERTRLCRALSGPNPPRSRSLADGEIKVHRENFAWPRERRGCKQQAIVKFPFSTSPACLPRNQRHGGAEERQLFHLLLVGSAIASVPSVSVGKERVDWLGGLSSAEIMMMMTTTTTMMMIVLLMQCLLR